MQETRISSILATTEMNGCRYCIFSVTGRDYQFLYYSCSIRPARALMFGNDFLGQMAGLREVKDTCIECALGRSVKGGVALDNGDLVSWHCTIEDTNSILTALKNHPGAEGQWIELF